MTQLLDPAKRCICGYRKFRLERRRSSSNLQAYVLVTGRAEVGFGSSPMGVLFGDGESGGYGLATTTRYRTELAEVCDSCHRVRSSRNASDWAVYGAVVTGTDVVLVTTGVPSSSCLSIVVRTRGAAPVDLYEVPVVQAAGSAPALDLETAGGVVDEAPSGALVANSLLAADLSDIPDSGTYNLYFKDRCYGTEVLLGTFYLETMMTTFHPGDADLGGVPESWVSDDAPIVGTPVQLQRGPLPSIPFDKCMGVLEYDARTGAKPSAQGWTAQGTADADWTLAPNGSLRGATPGGDQASYYEKSLTLADTVSRLHSWSRFMLNTGVRGAIGDGLEFTGLYGTGAAAYDGARVNLVEDALRYTFLDGSNDTRLTAVDGDPPKDRWSRLGVGTDFADDEYVLYNDFIPQAGTTWGTVGTAPATPTLLARFGDVGGNGLGAYVRSFVVSAPGRFVRAWFKGYSVVTDPVLRLYFVADEDGGGDDTARFLVRYQSTGPGGASEPWPSMSQGVTLDFSNRNTVVTASVTLTGLVEKSPFIFTVERDWDHADDLMTATARMTQAVLRAA